MKDFLNLVKVSALEVMQQGDPLPCRRQMRVVSTTLNDLAIVCNSRKKSRVFVFVVLCLVVCLFWVCFFFVFGVVIVVVVVVLLSVF